MPAKRSKSAPQFRVWAVDDVVYGPVDASTLAQWIQDERITTETWIFDEAHDAWRRAVQFPELQGHFATRASSEAAGAEGAPLIPGIKPGMLRRVKILSGMSDQQLGRFAQYMEVKEVRQWTEIVKRGIPGDAMYLVLAGDVRVRLMIGGMETTIANLGEGDFFGEISLFDHGPRSADVIANSGSVLLKISATAFDRMLAQAPELAAPFLRAICKTLAVRIRTGNKRLRDSISLARAANASW